MAIIYGGAGNDTLPGTEEGDTIYGEDGNDVIQPGPGANTVYAGPGLDTVDGGPDVDEIFGGDDRDRLDGAAGDDILHGEGGSDRMDGGADDDSLLGGDGDDRMQDSLGNNTLRGGTGNDLLLTGDGDDVLEGGADRDTLTGGGGTDSFILEGPDIVTDFDPAEDIVNLDPFYNEGTLADWNEAHPETQFDIPLKWMRHEQERGVLAAAGGAVIRGGGARPLPAAALTAEATGVLCFTAGTRIHTPRGPRPIETLAAGDLVLTRDRGPQPIRWIGASTVPGTGRFAPIRLRPGALPDLATELLVSPQHRLVLEGYRAELLFGEREVLAAAKHLVDGRLVTVEARAEVTYIHMLFDRHEIVFAHGAASESFHPASHGLDIMSAPAREELFGIFPGLRTLPGSYGTAARLCLKRHEVLALAG